MSKPNDVSQEAWDAAEPLIWEIDINDSDLYGASVDSHSARTAIARAIMAAKEEEREECARIVEGRIELFTRDGAGLTGRNALKEAANSICKRGEA
jgi:hypothetical protein